MADSFKKDAHYEENEELSWRDKLREIPLWGMRTFNMKNYDVIKVTKAQLKNKAHEGEWVITNKTSSTFTVQRIS